MKKQESSALRQLADLVGLFIRYWGFRRIHGEIWTVIYLSEKPLSGVEISSLLQVSKALVSPALKQLESEGLILSAPSENSKTKRYRAEEDVARIIRQVLKRREKPMIEKILMSYQKLGRTSSQESLNPKRVEKLGQMIEQAHSTLDLISESELLWR